MKSVSAVAFLILACAALAQESQHDMSQHTQHMQEMNARGERAMGFSQTATTHHFILLPEGGYVQVTTNKNADSKSVEQVRAHLLEIKKKFAAGDFAAPELTHGKIPPGVPEMKRFKSDIAYNVNFIRGGGRLTIASKNPDAIAAIHSFLKFQIEDHGTGDPVAAKD